MTREILDLVDEKDRVIGRKDREEIYRQGLRNYRVVNILIFDPQGRIWLPKRTEHKAIFPGCFDFSCGEHVVSGEDYQEAALRGLREELNLSITEEDLVLLGKLTPEEGASSFMSVYKITLDKAPEFNKRDFSSASFVTLEELGEMISDRPGDFKGDWPLVFNLILLFKASL